MEKKITLFHGSESLYKISKVLGCAMEDLLEK